MTTLAPPPNERPPYRLPPLPHAAAHERVMERLRTMTPEEFLASLVRSGICTPDGKLTPFYAGEPEADAAE